MAEPALRKVASAATRHVAKHGCRARISANDHQTAATAAATIDQHIHARIDAQAKQVKATLNQDSRTSSETTMKTLSDLPGPQGYPILGTAVEYFRKENRGQMHKVQRKFHEKYGKMFKEKLGPVTNVSIADPKLLEELFRKEGKLPFRPPYESWIIYKQLRGQKTGVMSGIGEDWYKARSTLSKKLLRPKFMREYIGSMNDVTDSFVNRIRYRRNGSSQDEPVPELSNEFCKWSTESVAYVLLEKRLGCLENEMPKDAQLFIDSVGKMFLTGHQLMVFANVHQRLGTKIWKTHVESLDNIYSIARKLIDDNVQHLVNSTNDGTTATDDDRTGFLSYLFANKNLSMDEIHVNTTELLLSGVDTTSNALGFALCLLAENPRVQKKLQNEIQRVLGNRDCETLEDLQELNYVKAIVKETLRLYPVVCINARVMKEDTAVGGHIIPANTCVLINTYTMSRDKDYFEEPDSFIPERWNRAENKTWDPFTSIPFGFGARSCLGRRIAEQELYLGIIKMAQNFWMQKTPGEIKPILRTILTQNEIPLKFVDR